MSDAPSPEELGLGSWLMGLEREDRVGVPHFKVGQHRAFVEEGGDEDVVVLCYVGGLGHAHVVLLERADGDWQPRAGMTIRPSWRTTEWFKIERLELSDTMRAAIADPVHVTPDDG